MGRKSKSGMSGGIKGLKDNTDFRGFIRDNMSNSEFKKFGQEHSMDEVHDLWIETRAQQEMKNLHEMDIEDAISQARDAIPNNELDGWFRDANSDYKPKLAESIMSNPGTLNDAIIYKKSDGRHEVQIPKSSSGSLKKTNSYDSKNMFHNDTTGEYFRFVQGPVKGKDSGGRIMHRVDKQYYRFDKKKGFVKTRFVEG